MGGTLIHGWVAQAWLKNNLLVFSLTRHHPRQAEIRASLLAPLRLIVAAALAAEWQFHEVVEVRMEFFPTDAPLPSGGSYITFT